MQRPRDSALDLKALQAAFGRSVRSATASDAGPAAARRQRRRRRVRRTVRRLPQQRVAVLPRRARAHLPGDCSDASAPISFASSRASTVRSIRRNTVTCTGSARHSRHGSPTAWRAPATNGLPTSRGWNGPARSPSPRRSAIRSAWSRSAASMPDVLPHLALVLQPSLRLVASPFPIWSVWQANQHEDTPRPSTSRGCRTLRRSPASRTEWRCTGSNRPIIDCCSTCARAMSLGDATAAAARMPRRRRLLGRLLALGLRRRTRRAGRQGGSHCTRGRSSATAARWRGSPAARLRVDAPRELGTLRSLQQVFIQRAR